MQSSLVTDAMADIQVYEHELLYLKI